MTTQTAAALAALVSGTLGFAGWQEATEAKPATRTALSQSAQKRVSANFKEVPASEVIAWLQSHGVNFVINSEDLAKDSRVTVNISDQPLGAAADAIASALGGHWQRQGDIRVFRKGLGAFSMPFPEGQLWREARPGSDREWEELKARVLAPNWKPGQTRAFVWGDGNFRMLDPKEMEKIRTEAGKTYAEALKALPKAEFKMLDPKEMQKLHEDMAKARVEMKMHPDIRVMDPKEMQKLHEDLAKARVEMKMHPDIKVMDPKEMHKLHEEIRRSMPKPEELAKMRMEGVAPSDRVRFRTEARRALEAPGAFRALEINRGNLRELVKSLTPEQREKHDRQGHLLVDDLTPAQRRMLGLAGGGNWTIVFSLENEKFTFRSGK